MNVDTILGIIFGSGFVGFVTVLVTSYRKLKRGAIDDDEAIINGLYKELERVRKQRDDAEAESEQNIERRRLSDEMAWWYRAQLLQNGITPMPPAASSSGTPDPPPTIEAPRSPSEEE